jgi:DNA polymerase-4
LTQQFHPRNGRVVAHVDCNSYFAAVEIANDSSLEGKPVVVAGNLKRNGIIIAASYKAREYGIYTTQLLSQAKKLCTDLVVKAPNFDLYRETSAKIFDFLSTITEEIEIASIDESYLDLTELAKRGMNPIEIAKKGQLDILEMFGIPTSWGIGPNKVLAKHASDWKKPNGLTIIRRRDVPHMLWPKPVSELHGCGEKTAEKLSSIGVKTIEDLAEIEEGIVRRLLGKNGVMLKNWANGIDNRPVDKEKALSITTVGNSTTLQVNTAEERVLLETFKSLAQSVSLRMKAKKVVTYTVQITIRYSDFKTITRSRTLINPVVEARELFQCAMQLFHKHWSGDSVRLLGISAQNVVEEREAVKQLDLFDFEADAKEVEKKEPLLQVVGQLKMKFGTSIIQTGADLVQKQAKTAGDTFKWRYGQQIEKNTISKDFNLKSRIPSELPPN